MIGPVVSPRDLFLIFLIGGVFLTRTSCLKFTRTCLLWCMARVGGFCQHASPNNGRRP